MESHPLRIIRSLGRSREIATVLLNYGFDDVVDRLRLRRYLQLGRRVFFWKRQEPRPHYTRAERIRLALESLGATFIKFGQVISTRPDLVPADIIDELSKLQEQVPPFSWEIVEQTLRKELGGSVDDLFAKFDREPLAAGSLGQVHRATHKDGALLAVKIRRPNVVRDVERDLALMMELSILIERHIPEAAVFDPVGLVNHFSRTIRRELNFSREARTVDEFAHLYRHDATLKVPKIFWDLTTESVVTMEFIDGFRIDQPQELEAAGISPGEVAANGARIFMKQAFEFGLFHGDPHPGNIRIMPDGAICLLDYGMAGILEEEKRGELIDLFLSVSRRDVRGAVNVIQRLGQPFRTMDEPLLRADVRDFVENYYGLPLDRFNVGSMLTDFVSILSNHGIRCPGDLMLLIRALVTLEGVGRELDPEFNLAEHLAPFIEKVVRERYNPRQILNRMYEESKTFLQVAHNIPLSLGKSLEKLGNDELKIQVEHRRLDRFINELDRSSNRVVVAVVMSALIVASALIVRTGAEDFWRYLPAGVLALSSLLGIWLIYGVFRSGRL